jgi:hypothetical protein
MIIGPARDWFGSTALGDGGGEAITGGGAA